MKSATEVCPDCRAELPASNGPTHRYIGASPACWQIYTSLQGAGEPPLTPAPLNSLLVDAYAAQHPGAPTPQAIRSVAVHTITLYAILNAGLLVEQVIHIRKLAVDERRSSKQDRFWWLKPPDFSGSITVAEIAALPTPEARTAHTEAYVREVHRRWMAAHAETIKGWYDQFVTGQEKMVAYPSIR